MWRSSGSSAQVYGEVEEFSSWQLISAMSRSHLGPRECLCCGCTGGEVGFIHAFQGARAAEECCAKKVVVTAGGVFLGAAPRMQLPSYLAGTCSAVGVGQLQVPLTWGSVRPAAPHSATMAATLHTWPSFWGSVGPSGEGSQVIGLSGRNQTNYM